ncbi:MAG: glycogen debranching protein GlgX [Acidimicrobiia bacterium]|nr:glycogen debranching protein GlgX [Acidimicrobiia bacterium]
MPAADGYGARWDGSGTEVRVHAPAVERVELCGRDGDEWRIDLGAGDGGWWSVRTEQLAPGDRYGLRAHGPRHNPNRLLLDPAARAVSGVIDWEAGRFDDPGWDSAGAVPWSVVVDPTFDWTGDRLPRVAAGETVVYEANVRSLTALHPSVPPEQRGTYLGLAHPAVVDHLLDLGVTTVELLPVHHFVDTRALWSRGLRNLWGYDPIAWFAPHAGYATGDRGEQVRACKTMVRTLHDAGLEVVIDVVFNHTGEYDRAGPTVCCRGWDDEGWYRHQANGSYEDTTGCRHSVDLRPDANRALVLAALRCWADELHVDGFRFDLATTLLRGDDGVDLAAPFLAEVAADPVLADRKLIAEPWDAAPDGYRVGGFPPPWAEWNDRFRNTVRDTWRGATPTRQDLATRLAGSADLFGSTRTPSASVNFVTAHDGFTLADLVAYEHKRNDANGEGGADGTDDNRSWNCGAEGPTDDPDVRALRARQQRNLLTTLLVARGTPMLVAGDELGRTQQGNNNAYAQDNEVSWVDWAAADEDLLAFTRRLLGVRRRRPSLRGDAWLTDEDVTWRSVEGQRLDADAWSDGEPALVMAYEDVVVALNPGADDRELRVPEGTGWEVVVDTTTPDGAPSAPLAGPTIALPARSALILAR